MRRLSATIALVGVLTSSLITGSDVGAAEPYPPGAIPLTVSLTPSAGPPGSTYVVSGKCPPGSREPGSVNAFIPDPAASSYVGIANDLDLTADGTFRFTRTVFAEAPIGGVVPEAVFCDNFSPGSDVVGAPVVDWEPHPRIRYFQIVEQYVPPTNLPSVL
jgi:hypothetical protein